jgi:transposase
MSRYYMTEFEWKVIEPLLPNKPRGVPRVDNRRVLNGVFWTLRSGSTWRDLPESYSPHTTCYNRFRRWTKAGIRDTITDAYGGDVRMIDRTSVRVHHTAATLKKPPGSMSWTKPGRSYTSRPKT